MAIKSKNDKVLMDKVKIHPDVLGILQVSLMLLMMLMMMMFMMMMLMMVGNSTRTKSLFGRLAAGQN